MERCSFFPILADDLSYGEWEGRRFEEVAVSDGERFQASANDPIHVSPLEAKV